MRHAGDMSVPAEQMVARAVAWAETDAAVRAAVVYGSVAQGTANEGSDLDLIVVAEPGQRDGLWDRRAEIGAALLSHEVVWSQEPHWQRPYRYQSWDENLVELDLTLDEEYASPWAALTKGFLAIVDKADVADRLRGDPAELRRSLRATAELYSLGLDRWSRRTGRPRPRSPLAPAILERLRASD